VFGRRGELILDVAGITLAAMVGIVLTGRFLYSSILLNAEAAVPAIGFITKPARAVWGQVYDPAGED
jgi:hypothetical protein